MPAPQILARVALVLIAIAIPWQWATIRYADVQLLDAKRDYDW